MLRIYVQLASNSKGPAILSIVLLLHDQWFPVCKNVNFSTLPTACVRVQVRSAFDTQLRGCPLRHTTHRQISSLQGIVREHRKGLGLHSVKLTS